MNPGAPSQFLELRRDVNRSPRRSRDGCCQMLFTEPGYLNNRAIILLRYYR